MNEHLHPPGIHQILLDASPSLMIDHDYRIRTLGKFEGCLCFVPFYWEQALDGMADYNIDPDEGIGYSQRPYLTSVFVLDETDIELMGAIAEKLEIRVGDKLELWENDYGFVFERLVEG